MSQEFYPKPYVPPVTVTPVNKLEAARRLIDALDAGIHLNLCYATVMAGTGTPEDFDDIVSRLRLERAAMWAVDPNDYATVALYGDALSAVAVASDPATWYTKVKAHFDVTTYAALQAAWPVAEGGA